jgi:hypothetical protein
MAQLAQTSTVYVVTAACTPRPLLGGMPRIHFALLVACLLLSIPHAAVGQRYPFIRVGGTDAPRGPFTLFVDSRSRLWLAGRLTGSEGIFVFDGSQYLPAVKNQSPIGSVSGMSEDSQGNILFAATNGVFLLSGDKVTRIAEGDAQSGITRVAGDVFLVGAATGKPGSPFVALRISLTDGRWHAETLLRTPWTPRFTVDPTGEVLFSCDGGYCQIHASEILSWLPETHIAVARHPYPLRNISEKDAAVLRDRFGCIWLRGVNGVLYECPGDQAPHLLRTASMGWQLFELDDGSIVIPSADRLVMGRPGKFRSFSPENGFPGSVAAVSGPDRTVWISSSHGLYVFPWRLGLEFWTAPEGLNGAVGSVVRRGDKLFAVADSIRTLDHDRSRWLRSDGPVGRQYPGPRNTLFVMHDFSLLQTDLRGRTLASSSTAQVWFMAKSKEGTYWAGGNGIFRVAVEAERLRLERIGGPRDYVDVQGMQTDMDGNLWACGEFGLAQISPAGNLLYHHGPPSPHGCEALTVDQRGEIWFADLRPPFLGFLDPRSIGPLQSFGGVGALLLASDHRGWIWRGSIDGIYIADLEQARTGQWLHLTDSDGLPGPAVSQAAFTEDEDGSVWIGAEYSAIHISPPLDLVHPGYAPSVFLSTFSWNGDPQQIADNVSQVPSRAPLTAHIGSLQFDRRSALHFSYRLKPEQSSWSPAPGFDLHFGKLHWGSHVLQLRAQLGDGPWSPVVSQSFTINRPLWLTWPALASFALAALVVGTGTLHWYRRRQQVQQKLIKAFPDLAEWRVAALAPELQQLDGAPVDGRFEVGRILARGGFAAVAEGRDLEQSGARCAIKIFRQELANHDWIERRFDQEVRALRQIRHPNVVRLYGSGILPGGTMYLAMEFIAGSTLREVLDKDKIPIPRVALYLRQMGSALDEIHAYGICHRDLKPENLMLRASAPPGQELVLIDFSIAIVKDPDQTMHGLSRAAGTLNYMAPEQAIGYADSASDIYSLAKIVIEMLTGQRLSALLPNASMDLPERTRDMLVALKTGMSAESIDLLVSALRFDPARRPSKAGDFAIRIAEDLERAS